MGEASAVKCFAETPNRKNRLAVITEPLEKGLIDRVRESELHRSDRAALLSSVLVDDFGWDELSADSVWAFGP